MSEVLYEFGALPLYKSFYDGGWLYQKIDADHALDVQRGIVREFNHAMFVDEDPEAPWGVGYEVSPVPGDKRHQIAC